MMTADASKIWAPHSAVGENSSRQGRYAVSIP
jgi:hypothetical protein